MKKQNQVTPSLKRQSEMIYIKSPNTGQNSLKFHGCVQILSFLHGPWLLALFPDTRFQMLLGLLHSGHLHIPPPLTPGLGCGARGRAAAPAGRPASCVVDVIIQETFPHFLTKKDVSLGFPQTFFIG